jgi:target of rapamycin complex subunit LST8
LAAAGNPHVRLFEIASQNPNPVVAYDGHTTNVTDVGFQKDGKWMFTGSEDGTIKASSSTAIKCLHGKDVAVFST